MPEIGNIFNLSRLSAEDRAHWGLHLNAVLKDTPSLKKEVDAFLDGSKLPKLRHPASIHDWLEQPDRRTDIEVCNG